MGPLLRDCYQLLQRVAGSLGREPALVEQVCGARHARGWQRLWRTSELLSSKRSVDPRIFEVADAQRVERLARGGGEVHQ